MCCGSYPNPIGMLISSLTAGTEVIILKGEGYPAVKKETCTLIWKVDGFSALTIDGIALTCQNVSDLIVTGNRYETYQVTAEAIQIWGEIIAAAKESEDMFKDTPVSSPKPVNPTLKFKGGDWDKLPSEPE